MRTDRCVSLLRLNPHHPRQLIRHRVDVITTHNVPFTGLLADRLNVIPGYGHLVAE